MSKMPKTRGECINGPRPCPHLLCKYHLWTDVTDYKGETRIRIRRKVGSESCCLDVADRGFNTLQKIADALGISRERVRQILSDALPLIREEVMILDGDDDGDYSIAFADDNYDEEDYSSDTDSIDWFGDYSNIGGRNE